MPLHIREALFEQVYAISKKDANQFAPRDSRDPGLEYDADHHAMYLRYNPDVRITF